MADRTFRSQPEKLIVTHDLDTGEAGLFCFEQYCFKISSSQMSALWALYRDKSGLGSNPLTLGLGGPIHSKLRVEYVESTTEAHLYMGLLTLETKVFRLTPGQWRVLRAAYEVWSA